MLSFAIVKAQDFELVSQQQEVNFFGWVTFRGYVRNVGDHIVRYPRVRITLKKAGKVIQVATGELVGPTADILAPGERGNFNVPTLTKAFEFDEIIYSFSGIPEALAPTLMTGVVILVERSLSLIDDGLGNVMFLGEFVNLTNAIVGDVVIRFTLYNGVGDFIGMAETGVLEDIFQPGEIRPGQVVPFIANSRGSFRDVATWKVEISYIGIRLAEQIVTPVQESSWGTIKKAEAH